jgi:hypothetical protein
MIMERNLVEVVVETALDAAEAGMFPSMLVGDIVEYTELEVDEGFTGVEVKLVVPERPWHSPGSRHLLRG